MCLPTGHKQEIHSHTHSHTHTSDVTNKQRARDLKLHCISSLMQGHWCDVSLSHICVTHPAR